MPWISCGIMGRPTKSYILFKQQGGRLMRPCDDYDDFILLDHALNVYRHGYLEDEKELNFEPKARRVLADPGIKICPPPCCSYYRGTSCPNCGGVKPMEIKTEKFGTLTKIREDTPEEAYAKELRAYARTARKPDGSKYKQGWKWFRMRERFGEDIANKFFPKRYVPDFIRRRLNHAK
jgi:superfamily II DNA or RNA helicase